MAETNTSPVEILELNFADGETPEWVQLIPAGPGIRGVDGRVWTMKDADKVVGTFRNRAIALPIDIAHATQVKGARGEEAIEAGKITPADRDFYIASCQAQGGLERFDKFVEAKPEVAGDSGLDGKDPAASAKSKLTPEELVACRAFDMAYATQDDIITLYVADRNGDGVAETDAVARALSSASGETDSYLGVRYSLPLETAPDRGRWPCACVHSRKHAGAVTMSSSSEAVGYHSSSSSEAVGYHSSSSSEAVGYQSSSSSEAVGG